MSPFVHSLTYVPFCPQSDAPVDEVIRVKEVQILDAEPWKDEGDVSTESGELPCPIVYPDQPPGRSQELLESIAHNVH